MPTVRNNERSEAIKVISHINSFLHDKTWCILSAGGETTITEGKKHMFPDVILYGDSAQTQVLQGWELKMPDIPIDNEEFVKDAQRKAITLGLNSCFIWNFTAGVLYERNEDNTFTEIKRWNNTNYIRTRQDVDTYRANWMCVIEEVLEEINNYFVTGRFLAADLGDIISDSVLCSIMERNKNLLADRLKCIGRQDVRVHTKIQNWWEQVKIEYASEETDAYVAYARIIILNWSNRILFSHVIKRYHNVAREIENLSYTSTPEEANTLFETISSTCDYYNIFLGLEYNNHLPQAMWRDLMELNEFLSNNAMSVINQTTLQTVLENTISSTKRELIGQFTTPEKLAMLLAKITMRDLTGPCIDPCCGTGSIAQAMLNNKIDHDISVQTAYDTTWASDKYSFPLQVASISMARVDAINQPVKIFQKNAFDLMEGQRISLVNPATGQNMTCELPLFETIASNLPFVPFEIIDGAERACIRNIQEQINEHTGVTLDVRSDLYQCLTLSLHKTLKVGGRLGIITSNSWLGTRAGRLFFNALAWYFKVEQIHISGNGRWFRNAEVVAVMLVLTKKETISAPVANDETRFYVWKKALQAMDATDIAAIASDAILDECNHPDLLSLSVYKKSEIDTLLSMNISLNALFHDVNWLIEVGEKACPVTNYLRVTRGERRGWDKMFYPRAGHEIEPLYIRRVLKSSRQLTSLCATPDSDAFCCSESIADLEAAGHTGALAWIRAFEHKVNNTGVPLPESLRRSNMHWYEMQDTSTAEFVTGMNPDKRLFVAKFDEPAFVNQRLIAFKRINDQTNADLLHALLNSMFSLFYIEAIGFGRGLGALDINATNIGGMKILNPALLNEQNIENILEAFGPLKERTVLCTNEELEQEDRIHFEHVVLRAFDIDQHFDSIKNALLSMQQVRSTARH